MANNSSVAHLIIRSIDVPSLISSVFMLALCVLGFFGNTISLIIFSRPSMQSTINVLLAGLSLVDLAVLVFAMPVFVAPSFADALRSDFIRHFYPFIVLYLYPLTMISQTCSIWTFVLTNVERYLAVCHPLIIRKLLTTRRTRLSFYAIVTMSIVYNAVRFWEFKYNRKRGISPYLRYDPYYFTIYHTTLYLITQFAGPLVVIVWLNVKMFRCMLDARLMRSTLTKRVQQQQKTTQMIITMTSLFGFCNTLPFVLNFWEAVQPDVCCENPSRLWLTLTSVANALVLLHSSTTFLIYLFYCKKYKSMFMVLLRIRHASHWRMLEDQQHSLMVSVMPRRLSTFSENLHQHGQQARKTYTARKYARSASYV